mmetsp:Transcript_4406/g.7481  ORF Transcript_4406/g.7481 Transcript_4406/m.7481 type:complete len:217 (-) Transcript_4406:771-1421(-)
MHILYQIYHLFESVEFQVSKKPAGFLSTWFDFPKSIRNNILVELNINSLSEVYALDAQAQKETIGSLNWKKFAERIQTQLAENQSLTKNQRRTMKINSIISLIKSNSFDEANKQLLACMKADEFRGEEKLMATLRNIQIYLQVKDKKYAEALAILEKNSKVASLTLAEVFMKTQLHLFLKDYSSALKALIEHLPNLKAQSRERSMVIQLILKLANN